MFVFLFIPVTLFAADGIAHGAQALLLPFKHIAHGIGERCARKREQEAQLLPPRRPALVERGFEFFVMHRLPELRGGLANLERYVEADAQVGDEHAGKGADGENHPHVAPRPDRRGVQRVKQQVHEPRRDAAPQQGKQRADDALNVPPLPRIVPQLDFQPFYENQPRNIFEQGERGDEDEHERPARERDEARPVQKEGAAAVHGQVRAVQKARVDPLFGTENAAEEQFEHPAADRADHE